MKFDVLSLFPEFFSSPLSESIIGRAIERGVINVSLHNIRDYATDKHHTTDDAPYGGGAGMLMKPEPVVSAIEAVRGEAAAGTVVLLTTPHGEPFSHKKAEELSGFERVIIVSGRYEGVDERIRSFVDMEVSVGDYVLTGGELPALTIIDAVARLVPGVLGDEESPRNESFVEGLLEYPQYTRPEEFRGMKVPEVLTSGNHREIERWRRVESLRRTLLRRPELLEGRDLTEEDKEFLKEIGRKEGS